MLDPFSTGFWIPVGLVFLCAGAVGLERQVRNKPVGVRTSILISLSTMVFVKLSVALSQGGGDPARVLGQIVTGVGFLGAGVMFARGGVVNGVTTAAVIWILAAIGAVIGFGSHAGAVALGLLTVIILAGMDYLERHVFGLKKGIYAGDADQDPDR